MTVEVQEPIISHAGNGTAAPLAVPFRFLRSADLVVTRITPPWAETVLVRGTDYSVSGAGASVGGSVTPVAPIAIGTSWRIERVTALEQPTRYSDGFYSAASQEMGLDRQMLALQELARDGDILDSRAIKGQRGEGVTLPPRSAMTGGNLILAPDRLTGVIGVLDGSHFRGDKGDKGDPGDKDGGAIVWLDDFIEEDDESDSDAIQRCHDWLAERIHYGETRVSTVMLGSRWHWFHRNVLLDKVAMRFIGRGCSKSTVADTGTWFIFNDPSFEPFTITRTSTTAADESRGGGFFNIGIYQAHPGPVGAPWAPTPYPHIFNCTNLLGEFTLDNIHCVNVNKLMTSSLSGRANITNITGQIFTNMLYADRSLDVMRISNVHLWTYWTSADEVMAYIQAELDVFIFARVDTPIVNDIFIFAARSMFRFVTSDFGYTTKFTAGIIACDFTGYGLWVESPNFTAQISVLNTQGENWPGGVGPLGDAKSIRVTEPNCTIEVATLIATDTPGASISIEAGGGHVSVGSALWDRINLSGGFGAFHLASGSTAQVDHWRIINSGTTGLSTEGGALATTVLQQIFPANAVSRVYAAAAQAGLAPKLYAEGAADDIDLELGAKGRGAVTALSGLAPKLLTVADLVDYTPAKIGTKFAVVDALSADGGSPVAGGGTIEAEVTWLNGAWRVGGGSIPGSDTPGGSIVVIVGHDEDGNGVQQPADEMLQENLSMAALAEWDSGLEVFSDEVRLRAAGAVLTGAAGSDDAPALAALLAASGAGVSLNVSRAMRMRLGTQTLIDNKPFSLVGGAASYALSQGTGIEIACPDAFDIRNSDGFSVRNAHIRASGTALTSGSIFDFKGSDISSSNSGMLLFDHLRIEGGWNAFTFRKVFQAQLRGVRVANMAGEYCFGHNGLNDDSQANIFEYHGVTAGGVRYSNCDLWVFNGGGGSAKFTDCAGNFGRHGMVIKSETLGPVRTITSIAMSPDEEFRISTSANHGFVTGDRVIIDGVSPAGVINDEWTVEKITDTVFDLTDSEYVSGVYTGGTAQKTQGRDPGFIYWQGGGFENLGGDAFRLERGGSLLVSNAYFSTDSTGNIVNQFATYKGRVKFTNCAMRAAGGHGLLLRAGNASFSACDIVNCGRVYVDNLKVAIASVADNGSGYARITTTAPHGYSTGDRVRISRTYGVDGSTRITVISPNVFDADLIPYAASVAGGSAWRFYRGVTNVVDHGDGRIRVTVPGHPFKDGDWVHFSTASVGVPGVAGGDFKIAYVDADNFVLALSIAGSIPAFSGAYTSGGYVQYCSAQIVIAAGATSVDITGCFIGTSSSGVNRARYAVIIEPGCTNINIDSTISLDSRSAVVNLSASEPTVKVTNRRSPSSAMLELLRPVTPVINKLIRLDSAGGVQLIDWSHGGGIAFTPVVTCATPGDLSVAYGTATGTYRKKDRVVEIDVVLVFTPTYTTAAGEFRIAGLPFPADGSTAYSCIPISSMSAFTWPNSATQIYLEAQGNQSYLMLVGQKSGSSNQSQNITGFTSGAQVTLRFRGSYIASS